MRKDLVRFRGLFWHTTDQTRTLEGLQLPPLPVAFPAHLRMRPVSRGSSKATLWVKAPHEGALPPPCIVRKDPRVPHTARRGRETGLILRCAGKAGNPFQTTQWNRLSCSDQEGRRGSEEAVPGPSEFPSREPGVSGLSKQSRGIDPTFGIRRRERAQMK